MQSMYINSIFSKKNHVFLENIYSILFILWKVIGNVVVRGRLEKAIGKVVGKRNKKIHTKDNKKKFVQGLKARKITF